MMRHDRKKLSPFSADALLNSKVNKFLVIYETANIHKAAEALHISQPALTVALKQLEETIGDTLFTRSVHGLEPTPAGDMLYRYASSMRQTARLAAEAFAEAQDGATLKLRVGAGVAWTTTVLPTAISDLRALYPSLSVNLIAGVGDQLAALCVKGELDMFFAAGPVIELNLADIRRKYMTNLSMVAVADPRSTIAQKKTVTAADLVKADWAGFYEDESFVHLSNHYMSVRGLPTPNIVMRTNSVAALTSFIRGSETISLLISPLADAVEQSGLIRLPMNEPLWDVPMHLFVRDVVLDLPMVARFIELIEERMRTFSQGR